MVGAGVGGLVETGVAGRGAEPLQQAFPRVGSGEVDDHALSFGLDPLHGAGKEAAAGVVQRGEGVGQGVLGVHPHEHAGLPFRRALHQRQVDPLVDLALVAQYAELAPRGAERRLDDPRHQPLPGEAVGHELFDRDELEVVLGGHRFQCVPSGHCAVLGEDFADDSDGREAGEAGQVHGRFGLSHPAEHAALARPKRKDVAGAPQVAWNGGRVHEGLNGPGPVVGRDARGDAEASMGVHRHREGSALGVGVAVRHQGKLQGVRPFRREGDAHEAATVADHEVDQLRRRLLRGAHQVALVLPVLVVGDDDQLARGYVANGVGNGVERHEEAFPTGPGCGRRGRAARTSPPGPPPRSRGRRARAPKDWCASTYGARRQPGKRSRDQVRRPSG